VRKCQETEEERTWLRECRFFIYKYIQKGNDAEEREYEEGMTSMWWWWW